METRFNLFSTARFLKGIGEEFAQHYRGFLVRIAGAETEFEREIVMDSRKETQAVFGLLYF